MPDLKDLVSHREDILLAEVAAWLHDYRKCSDEQLRVQSKNPPSGASGLPRDELTKRFPALRHVHVDLLGETIEVLALLKWDHNPTRKRFGEIGQYLVRSHHTSHFDKQEPPKGEGEQDHNLVYLSTPFGYESDLTIVPRGLTKLLFSRISWSRMKKGNLSTRGYFLKELGDLFTKCGADTRRPVNEITLWNWGHTVGSLYKAALAGALLGFQPAARSLRWRLLSVRFDGLAFFAKARRLSDLQARQRLLAKALDRVRDLLEWTYPLGAEIYRDENGSVFVVPGCGKPSCALDTLTLKDGTETLHDHILSQVKDVLEGEIVPAINVDSEPWWGQDPDWRQKQERGLPSDDELPPITQHLQPVVSPPDQVWVEQQWAPGGTLSEICTVCGLRPQGSSPKALAHKVCDVCEQRRNDRAERWVKQSFGATIWLGEVADQHNRIALLVGTFDLSRWLEGTLVHSLAARDPSKCGVDNKKCPQKSWKYVSKNPSFARLRRIWETTRKFWQEVAPTDEDNNLADSEAGRAISKESTQRKRLQIKGNLQPVRKGDTPGPYHAYELELPRGVRLSVVWDPKNERFITADNLDYLEGKTQLGQPLKNVLRKGSVFRVLEPIGYGASDKVWGEITLSEDASDIPASEYIPLIPILAEPRTFMALVPADKAVDIVQAIHTKYEREMGKVCNRLPLHLGVVFADAHTPLRAILDAGRRMLKQKAIGKVGKWEIAEDVTEQSGALLAKAADLAQGTQQFDKWYAVKLKHGGTGRALTWYVPAVMGDGSTEDNWYPYVFLVREDEPTDRNRYFLAPNPWNASHKWLVHAGDLQKGDIIYFTPATLDFQWLDNSASRFEIAYDGESGQRKGNLSRRPYLLDELDTLEHIWNTLSEHLTTSQIHALVSLIESRREDWRASSQDNTFRAFCRDALANAKWKSPPWPSKDKKDQWLSEWAEHAARGWITDAVEIRMKIMKEKPVADKIQGGNA